MREVYWYLYYQSNVTQYENHTSSINKSSLVCEFIKILNILKNKFILTRDFYGRLFN